MRDKEINPFDPYSLGNERYYLWVTIDDAFVQLVGAGLVRGKAVRIKIKTGPDSWKWIPEGSKIGIWTKGTPADIEYERLPPELKIIDLHHIKEIKLYCDMTF